MRTAAKLVGGILAGAIGCAGPGAAQEASIKVITTTLTRSGAHKECVSLSASQSLRYWFRADAPIDFSLQYRVGDETVMPVRQSKVAIGSGSFAAKVAEVHCMVLTNASGKPVTARLEFARLSR